MRDSGILIVHLRERVPEETLRDELAKLLGLAKEDLVPIDAATATTRVPYQYTPRARGFQATIELYTGRAPASAPTSDLALAEHIARHFAQDVLISPPAGGEDPYRWLLVRPDGTTADVAEIASDDEEDAIVIADQHV
jgi:hypothetical protein